MDLFAANRPRPQPRPYQSETLDAIERLYHTGTNRQLAVLATGLGKAILFALLPERFPELMERGMLVLVHRKELVEQAAEKIRWANPWLKTHIEMGGLRAYRRADVVVASVQTLGREGSARLAKFTGRFGIVVVDECHHVSVGSQYDTVLSALGVGSKENDGRRLSVGFTATPNRNDGRGLHYFYDDIVTDLNVRWGVENGYLVDIRAMRVKTGTDISGVKTQSGDFAVGELETAVDTHERNEVIVKAWLQNGGRQGIAFCAGVKHAYELAETFQEFGIDARAIDGSMEKDHREIVIESFRRGEFSVLTNCQVATEGFDVPAVDTVLMARPTKSTPLYTQMLGRGTRPVINPDQETAEERVAAIRDSAKPHLTVIDFTDNVGKHAIVTTPKLFGLDAEFELKKKSVFEVICTIEKAKTENPAKNFGKAKSLEDIKIIAETVSVWDIAEMPKCLEGVTEHHWLDTGDGYQLHVPASMCGDRDQVIKLIPDRLGRFQAEVVKPPVFQDGRMVKAKEVIRSDKLHNSYEDAIHAVDAWVSSTYPGVKHIISQGQRWQEAPASKAQLDFLRKLRVQLPQGIVITKGMASRAINAAKNNPKARRTAAV